jgi:flagellar basal body P-ring formation protein FlgA
MSMWLALGVLGMQAPTSVQPVLAHFVARGDILSLDDFVDPPAGAKASSGAIAPEAASGLEARHALSAGEVVHAADVGEPRMVKRGEPVMVKLRSGGLTITASGRALADGHRSELVRVVVGATSHTLDAVVDAPGVVRVAIAN